VKVPPGCLEQGLEPLGDLRGLLTREPLVGKLAADQDLSAVLPAEMAGRVLQDWPERVASRVSEP
jgi:hypothetical protein